MLDAVAWLSLGVGFLCAVIITAHEIKDPQKMGVMNLVWPLTALYLSVFGLFAYFRFGVPMTKPHGHYSGGSQMDMGQKASPTLVEAAVSATHCGAGCVLGDIVSEFAVYASGAMILGSMLWASSCGPLSQLGAWESRSNISRSCPCSSCRRSKG